MRKVRIGYHCSFMNSDTIRFIMGAIFRCHDRSRFTVYGYSFSEVAPDIAEGFDVLRVTHNLPDEQFAALVRADGIDVFVEMTGFSPHHRFGAMAHRCAPVQVSYLNHSSTCGVPNVDYVFADEVSVPPGDDAFFTEKVWRLPGAFLCYNYDAVEVPPVAPPPSLANGYVTFGCFGSGGKINEDLVGLWSRVMHAVPGSRFYLRNAELTPRDNQRFAVERFGRFGITPDRVIVNGGAPRSEFIRAYDDVDISFDTWPYCGGNTVAESVWQGVPVITLKGERFSTRYGAALVVAAGTPELVADNAEDYVAIAIELARSPERLQYYRANLRTMAREHGLVDAGRFAKKLEDAYVSMLA